MAFEKRSHNPILPQNLTRDKKLKFPHGFTFGMNNAIWKVTEEIKDGPDEHRRVRSDSGEEEIMLLAVLQRDASNLDMASDFSPATQDKPVEEPLTDEQAYQQKLKAKASKQSQKILAKKSKASQNIEENEDDE